MWSRVRAPSNRRVGYRRVTLGDADEATTHEASRPSRNLSRAWYVVSIVRTGFRALLAALGGVLLVASAPTSVAAQQSTDIIRGRVTGPLPDTLPITGAAPLPS